MDTRLRTRMRAGGSRLHYQQFNYSSTETEDERSDVFLPSTGNNPDESIILSSLADEPEPIPEIRSHHCQCPENEAVPDIIDDIQNPPIQIPTNSAETSLSGTSAPLLTNPSLTDKLSNFPIWPLIENSVLNPSVGDNDAESPISGDEPEPFPLQQSPPMQQRPLPNPRVLLEGINTINREVVHQVEQDREPCCHVATNNEVLSEALVREDVPEADHLVQHVLNPTPPLVLATLYLWTLTPQLQVRLSPQIKHRHQNPLMLVMVCDVIVFPDIVVEHVVYDFVNVIICFMPVSQLDPGESC